MSIERVGGKIGTVGRLGKLRPRTPKVRALPAVELPEVSAVVDLEPAEVKELRRRLGDDPATGRMIKRVLRLRLRLPNGTLPELIAYDWLRSKGVHFTFQAEAFGGRGIRGGQIPDFVIPQGGRALCWRIQGEYWHSRDDSRARDAVNKAALLAGSVGGMRVWAVVDCWEDDIYRDRERVFEMAMTGTGIRE